MVSHKLLSFSDAAQMLSCTVEDVRRLVMEDRTLRPVMVNRDGNLVTAKCGDPLPFQYGGLQIYDVDQDGALTDRSRGGYGAGYLRFQLTEVVRHLAEYSHSVASAAPLAAPHTGDSNSDANAPVIELPDPERRLAALRAIGGTATRRAGVWRFTGIAVLVANEKSRRRSTEKTIREDLKVAVQDEYEAKQTAALLKGLGQSSR